MDKFKQKVGENRLNTNGFHKIYDEYWMKFESNFSFEYGSNIPGTLIVNNNQSVWNLNKLQSFFSSSLIDSGTIIEGVNTPMLYFGRLWSTFAWHVEDKLLFSASYLHEGAEKIWVVVSPDYASKFEQLAKDLIDKEKLDRGGCEHFLKHKNFVIDSIYLQIAKIPFKIVILF